MEETRSLPRTIVPYGAVYRTRGGYATGTAARAQLGKTRLEGRGLKFLGCCPDSASIQEICWARASSSKPSQEPPRRNRARDFKTGLREPPCCGTASPCGGGNVLRRKLLPQRQKQQNETSRACLDTSVELPGADLCTAARSRDHSMTCNAHVSRISASALMSSVRTQCVARIFVRYGRLSRVPQFPFPHPC
jgi:hypothetical protein